MYKDDYCKYLNKNDIKTVSECGCDWMYFNYAAIPVKAMPVYVDITQESAQKIIKDLKAMMTVEDAYELAAQLLAAVVRAVDDQETIRRIQYEFAQIIGDSPNPEDRGSGGPEIHIRPRSVDIG